MPLFAVCLDKQRFDFSIENNFNCKRFEALKFFEPWSEIECPVIVRIEIVSTESDIFITPNILGSITGENCRINFLKIVRFIQRNDSNSWK